MIQKCLKLESNLWIILGLAMLAKFLRCQWPMSRWHISSREEDKLIQLVPPPTTTENKAALNFAVNICCHLPSCTATPVGISYSQLYKKGDFQGWFQRWFIHENRLATSQNYTIIHNKSTQWRSWKTMGNPPSGQKLKQQI